MADVRLVFVTAAGLFLVCGVCLVIAGVCCAAGVECSRRRRHRAADAYAVGYAFALIMAAYAGVSGILAAG